MISGLLNQMEAKSIQLHGYIETQGGAQMPQETLASMPSEAKTSV
jgi:hypothetical protein